MAKNSWAKPDCQCGVRRPHQVEALPSAISTLIPANGVRGHANRQRAAAQITLLSKDQNTHAVLRDLEYQQGSTLLIHNHVRQLLRQPSHGGPHYVLLDLCKICSRGPGCLECTRKLLPQSRIIVLSASADEQSVLRCMTAGANGYLLKPLTAPEVTLRLRECSTGGTAFSPGALSALVRGLHRLPQPARHTALTPREQQIGSYLVAGLQDKEIAGLLNMAPATVHSHLARMYKKLGVHNRHAARELLARTSQAIHPAT